METNNLIIILMFLIGFLFGMVGHILLVLFCRFLAKKEIEREINLIKGNKQNGYE